MKKITSKLTDEAKSAPDLFCDLAKVELYIAESYRTRAIVEMLQNADDAGATRFFVCLVDGNLIIANNGKPFCNDDVISLCRSGSSTKTRGSGKIGYRGIGFKSVAGVCKNVKILSGEFFFEFSKSLTKKVLNIDSDVPLIRLPHPLSEGELEHIYENHSDLKEFSTIFVLDGLDERLVEEEISLFNPSSILFLNNIIELNFKLPTNNVSIKKQLVNESIVEINTSGNIERWHVSDSAEHEAKVALKHDGEKILPASVEESVIHAFLPTEECPGAFIKMNGDFSTDPSRKRIDLDEASMSSFSHCCRIIGRDINLALSQKIIPGFFSVFKGAPNNRFKKLLKEELLTVLKDNFHIYETIVDLEDIRLKPTWLNYQDYNDLKSPYQSIPKELDEQYPELLDFLTWLGGKELSEEECLTQCEDDAISVLGSFEIISRAAKKYRFNMPEMIKSALANKVMFPTNNGLAGANEISNAKDQLQSDFLSLLQEAENSGDIKFMLKRIGIEGIYANSLNKIINPIKSTVPEKNSNRLRPQVKKWRSAELNVRDWFSGLSEVLLAKDVSKSHVGYDVEVKLKDGTELYVEVKSVNSFEDAFEITNNEYAIGSQLGSDYLIAIVVENQDEFSIKFLRDPVSKLNFEKRIKSISWVCDEYVSHLTDLESEL